MEKDGTRKLQYLSRSVVHSILNDLQRNEVSCRNKWWTLKLIIEYVYGLDGEAGVTISEKVINSLTIFYWLGRSFLDRTDERVGCCCRRRRYPILFFFVCVCFSKSFFCVSLFCVWVPGQGLPGEVGFKFLVVATGAYAQEMANQIHL